MVQLDTMLSFLINKLMKLIKIKSLINLVKNREQIWVLAAAAAFGLAFVISAALRTAPWKTKQSHPIYKISKFIQIN